MKRFSRYTALAVVIAGLVAGAPVGLFASDSDSSTGAPATISVEQLLTSNVLAPGCTEDPQAIFLDSCGCYAQLRACYFGCATGDLNDCGCMEEATACYLACHGG